MFGSGSDEAFINDAAQANKASAGWNPWGLLLVIAAGIGAFFYWASTYEIEEVTSGTGRVIPSQQVQVVQSLEGGIVRRGFVEEGDTVDVGDALLQIDDTGFAAQLGELREREAALLAEEMRLRAEAEMRPDVDFSDALMARAPLAVAAERDVFLSRRNQLSRELAVLDDQLAQRRAALAELLAEREKLEGVIAPLSQEVTLTADLVARAVAPQVDLLRLQARLAELEGDLLIGQASEPRLAASIAEAESQAAAARSAYVLSARQRLATLQLELAVAQEALRAARDRVTRTQIVSPVRGTVNTLHATTIGAVVQPGQPLVEIVPADDSLLIEAEIRPQDVAFVRPGDTASVKITAYDYLVYGALEGEVVRLGADTIEDSEGQEFFRVVVRTGDAFLGTEDAPLPISPGMVASVDIQTGRKTVLSYLAKPLLRAQSEALRER
ncbi:MAG: HlyD family type I secretion periplasmic adaptor subunit [Pseudomonadota bacterium]